jgi:hypothetical protein
VAVSKRGILCTIRKNVVIEHNTFKHLAMDAIFISNDSQDWYESGPVRDVICSNTFFVTRGGNAEWRNAAIRIHTVTKGSQLQPFEQSHPSEYPNLTKQFLYGARIRPCSQ